MIKNIFFDMGGVLVPLNKERTLNAFRSLGIEKFADYLNPYLQKGFFARFENGDISAGQFRDCVREISSDNNISDEQIDNALNLFLDPLPAEREAMLRELKEEYRLYLLSNNNPISFTHINKEFEQNYGYQFKELFIEMFCSYKMNMSKPSETIFLKALGIAGANSGETLFIDDSPANIEAAAGLGFITCLYDVEKPFTEQVRRALANG